MNIKRIIEGVAISLIVALAEASWVLFQQVQDLASWKKQAITKMGKNFEKIVYAHEELKIDYANHKTGCLDVKPHPTQPGRITGEVILADCAKNHKWIVQK